MSWTTNSQSPRPSSLTSTKPSSLSNPLHNQLNSIHSSTLRISKPLLVLKVVSRCSAPVVLWTARRTKRSKTIDQSPPATSTKTNYQPPQSLMSSTCRMERRKSGPSPRSLLPQELQPHPNPRWNLRQRQPRCFHITLTRCQNPPLQKTTKHKDPLFRGRSGWLGISSSLAYRRRSHR